MQTSSMFFALLLSSFALPAALAAQTSAAPAAQTSAAPAVQASTAATPAVLSSPSWSHACPVGFSVARKPVGAIVETGKSAQAPHGQGVNVSFGRPTRLAKSQAQIISAEITVHGMSPGVHFMPAASASSRPDDATETFELSALAHPSVWTKNMNVVTWVELTRLTYADGTTWQPSAPGQCGAAPSSYLLVNSFAR